MDEEKITAEEINEAFNETAQDKVKSAYDGTKERLSTRIKNDPIMLRSSYKFDLALVRRSDPDDKLIALSANSQEKEFPLLKVLIVTAGTAVAVAGAMKLYDLGFNAIYKKRFGK